MFYIAAHLFNTDVNNLIVILLKLSESIVQRDHDSRLVAGSSVSLVRVEGPTQTCLKWGEGNDSEAEGAVQDCNSYVTSLHIE